MLIYERKSKKKLTVYPEFSTEDNIGTQIDYREVEKFVPEWI